MILTIMVLALTPAYGSAANTIDANYLRAMEAYEAKDWQLAGRLSTLTLSQIESRDWQDWIYGGERQVYHPYFTGDYVYLPTSDEEKAWKMSKVQIIDPSEDELVRIFDFTPWTINMSSHSRNYTIMYLGREGYIGHKIVWFEKGRPENERTTHREGIESFRVQWEYDTDIIDMLEKGPQGWGLSVFDPNTGEFREIHTFEKIDIREDAWRQYKVIRDENTWILIDGSRIYSLDVGSWKKEHEFTLPFEISIYDEFCKRCGKRLNAVRDDTLFLLRHEDDEGFVLRTIELPFPMDINHWSKKIDVDASDEWFVQSDSDSLRIFRLNGNSARQVLSTDACMGGTFALNTSTFWKGDTLIHYGNTGLKIFKGSAPIYSIDWEDFFCTYIHDLETFLIYKAPGEFSALNIGDLEILWTKRYSISHPDILKLLKNKYLIVNHMDGTSLLDLKPGEELLEISEVATFAQVVNEDTTKILLQGENSLGVYEISNRQKLKSDLIAVSACSKWAERDTTGALKLVREALARGTDLSSDLTVNMLDILHELDLQKESIRLIGDMAIRTGEPVWEKKLKQAGAELIIQPYLADYFAILAMGDGVFAFPVLTFPFSVARADDRKCYWFRKPDYNPEELMLPIAGLSLSFERVFFFEYSVNSTGDKIVWSPVELTDSGELRNLGPMFETKRALTNPDNQFFADYSAEFPFDTEKTDRALVNFAITRGVVGGKDDGFWRSEFTAGIDMTGVGNNWCDTTTVNPVCINGRFYAHRYYGDLLTRVAEGSQADSIGVHDGDIAISLGGYEFDNIIRVNRIKTYYPDRARIDFAVLRDGDTLHFDVLNGMIGYDWAFCYNLVEIDPETGEHLSEMRLPPGYEVKGLNPAGELVYTFNDTLLFFNPISSKEKRVLITGIGDYDKLWLAATGNILLMAKEGLGEILALDISNTADDTDRVLWKQTFEDIYRIGPMPRYCITGDYDKLPILLEDGTLLIIEAVEGSVLSRETLPFQNFGFLPQIWDGILYGTVASNIFGWKVAYYHPPFPWEHMGYGASALVPLFFIGLLLHRARVVRLKRKQAEELKRAEVEAEISAARSLQAGLIPTGVHRLGKFELVGKFVPASEVGGDYFDFRLLEDGRLIVVMGDVSGHGLPAGILVSMAKASLMTVHRNNGFDFVDTLESLNEVIRNGSPRKDMFMTLCYLMIDPKSNKIGCSANGHPFPLIAKKDGTVSEIGSGGGYPLGVRDKQSFRIIDTDFQPGDTILVYTDGIPEQMNLDDEPWGYEEFFEAFRDLAVEAETESLVDRLLDRALLYGGAAARMDDMALVAIRYNQT